MKRTILILILAASFSTNLYSDSTFSKSKIKPRKTTVWQDLGNDLKYFASDWGSYLTLPLRMDGKDVLITSAVVGGTVITSTLDKDIRKGISRQGYETYNHDFWDGPTAYGFVQYPSIFGGALYTIGLVARESELRKTGRMMIQSLAYSGTLIMGLRYLFGRHRPFVSSGNQYEFSWFNSAGDTQSFPSGHTVVAFATSTILAEKIDTWWARVVCYGFAALTAYARLYNDKHWFSDVFFGAALGYGTSMFVLNRERERERKEKQRSSKDGKKGGGLNFYPGLNGFSVTYGF